MSASTESAEAVRRREGVRTRLLRALAEVLEEEISPGDEASLMGDLGLESVQVLELLGRIEQEFQIEIDPVTTEPIERFGELVDAIVAWTARGERGTAAAGSTHVLCQE